MDNILQLRGFQEYKQNQGYNLCTSLEDIPKFAREMREKEF